MEKRYEELQNMLHYAHQMDDLDLVHSICKELNEIRMALAPKHRDLRTYEVY